MSRVRSTSSTVLRRIGQVIAWTVLLGSVLLLLAAVVVPRIAGATPYTVLTGSMGPDMPPGTLVIARKVDPADLEVGDVVTVQLKSGERSYVTHRIVGIGTAFDGQTWITTRGDANDAPDDDLRRPEQIVGKRWYWIPVAGRVQELMTGDQRALAVRGVAAGLGLYAAWMLASALRERRKDRTCDDSRESVSSSAERS